MRKSKLVAIIIAVLVPLLALASVTVTVNGTNHTIPQTNERGWGSAVTAWIQAISSNTLQPIGGTFTLTNDVDFGASYGLKSSYLSTRSSNPSTSGILRLNKTDSIGWRNNANSSNLLLGIDASDNLTFAGDILTTTGAGIFSDDGFYIYDLSDSTKKIDFDPGGTTGTKTTLTGAQTANRVITFPDATATLVGADTTQTLTNKTINGSNNTISNVSLSTAVTGTLPITSGGTGQTSASAAFDALAPSQGSNSGKYLTTNGTTTSWGTVDALPSQGGNNGKYLTTDGSASSWSSISLSSNVTGTLPITSGGTGQTGANAAFNALAPSQTSNSGKFLTTNGTDTSWATAALTAQGQSEGSGVTTTTIKAPYTQITTTGTDTRLIETGYNNLLLNPSFEHTTATTSWTQGSGTSCAAETTEVSDGAKSLLCTLTAATADSVYQDVTPTVKMSGINFEYGVWIKTASTTLSVCARQAAATVGSCTTVIGDSVWHYYPINYPGPSSGSVGVAVVPLSSTTGTYYIDAGYVGKARNIGTVAQASFVGSLKYAGNTGCNWGTTSTSLAAFAADTDCATPTVTGSATAPGTKIPGVVFSNLAPGTYKVTAKANVYKTGTVDATFSFAINDGTTTSAAQMAYENLSNAGYTFPLTSVAYFTYTSAQSSVTFQVYGQTDNASNTASIGTDKVNRYFEIAVEYFPSAAQTVVNMNQSNYDWIACPTGYASSWTANTTTTCKVRRSGGDAEFQFANTLSGAPTAAALTFTLPTGFAIDTTKIMSTTQYGQTLGKAQGYDSSAGTAYFASVLYNSSTTLAIGYESSTLAIASLYNSTAPITWATGDIITASFKVPISGWTENQNAPLLVGGVTSNTTGMERVERATVTCSSSSSITSQSGSWISSIGNLSSGACTLTLTSGMFSATPTCMAVVKGTLSTNHLSMYTNETSATSVTVGCTASSTGSSTIGACTGSNNFNVICMGPR